MAISFPIVTPWWQFFVRLKHIKELHSPTTTWRSFIAPDQNVSHDRFHLSNGGRGAYTHCETHNIRDPAKRQQIKCFFFCSIPGFKAVEEKKCESGMFIRAESKMVLLGYQPHSLEALRAVNTRLEMAETQEAQKSCDVGEESVEWHLWLVDWYLCCRPLHLVRPL